jgi:hypothetical protein
MGLHQTAHYLKTKGRGKDTELVHMTPKEIKGLQALAMAHGGSLTINPNTGLPEAGFLEDILPIVAAAGLTYLTAGAAAPTLTAALGGSAMAGGIAAGALSGAAISGGMAAIQGKDAGKAALMGGLGGAISGGMGAYDAANVFNAPNILADTAQTMATSTPEVATKIAEQGVTNADVFSGLAGQPTVAPGTMPPTASVNPGFTPVRPDAAAQGITGVGPDLTSGTMASSAPSVSPSSAANASRVINTPTSYYSGLGSGAMDTAKKVGIQALPALAGAMGAEEEQQFNPQDPYNSRLKRISPDFRAYEPPRPNPYYSARYAAEGGVMNSFDGESDVAMATGGATKLPKGDPGIYKDDNPTTRGQDAFTAALTRLNSIQKRANIKGLSPLKAVAEPLGNIETAAKGGIMSGLGGYSDGGRMLKGPGDGMSDSIPGVIGKKQPARLADGEFVVPADVVSHLGNGSTDAGAKRLYAMMDNIRKARTGKKKQAPAVKADRYMPA